MAARAAWGVAVALGLAGPAAAEGCRLALALALDVSGSVDPAEDLLQRDGLARALLAPDVVEAFGAGEPVALLAFEWSGPSHQADLAGWVLVRGEADLRRVAAAIRAGREEEGRAGRGGTALGAALLHAGRAFRDGPACAARTVDLSGDGENNAGPEPAAALAHPSLRGVTVNALVVDRVRAGEVRAEEIRLVAWFRAHVLRGPGAFWVRAEGYADYERAMRVKLLRELELPVVGGTAAEGATGAG